MNGSPSTTISTTTGSPSADTTAVIDASCRVPLLLLFLGAAAWLLVGSCFGLIASIKFHSPGFLSESAWLTYGRVRPVYTNALLYGFGLQAALGLGMWLFARLGLATLKLGLLAVLGTLILNLGVLVGLVGILAGDSTGFEHLEMPGYAAVLVLIGYLLAALTGVFTFQSRSRRPLAAPQWFLLAALVWFPWIYSTAELLLVTVPVRGVAQAVIAWWFSQNFVEVWLGMVGLAAIFYLVPVETRRPLPSRYLALFAFWILILFTSGAAVPGNAPVPAWMPAWSYAARVISITLLIAVAMNVYGSVGRFVLARPSNPPLSFVLVGLASFLLAGGLAVLAAVWDAQQQLLFTWFTPGRWQFQVYGFFTMVCLGGIYYVLPRITGTQLPWGRLVRAHFWLAAVGLFLVAVPFTLAGFMQAVKMQNASVPFVDIARSTLHFLRLSTVGELLLLIGHFLLLTNIVVLGTRLVRARFVAVSEVATQDMYAGSEAKA